jgi:hypothetical protein
MMGVLSEKSMSNHFDKSHLPSGATTMSVHTHVRRPLHLEQFRLVILPGKSAIKIRAQVLENFTILQSLAISPAS